MGKFNHSRNIARSKFGASAKDRNYKIQVGARGEKFADDWVAIDLFDTSIIIDHNWDIMDLPIENDTVDCIVCNAVLEHVPYPELAVYEINRVLRIGGIVWVEVPFLQAEHGHPFDFHRWTTEGIKVLMQDFKEIHSGISAEADTWLDSISRIAYKSAGREAPNKKIEKGVETVQYLMDLWNRPTIYDSVHYWGEKFAPIDPEKQTWMTYLKNKYRQGELLVPDHSAAKFPKAI